MESSCCHGGFRPKHWLLLIIAVGAIALGALSIIRERIVNPPQYQVTFTGHGRVFAKPDIAQVTLGVRTDRRPTAVKAVTENTEKMNQVIAKVKELGIEDKDIKTTSYNLSPEYNYDYVSSRGSSTLAGYSVYQEVTLKIRNLDDIGKVIEATTSVGANQVGNIAFTIDDTDELKKQARTEAIAKAKARAEEVAAATGIRLGKLVNVYENEYQPPIYDYGYAKTEALGMGGASAAPAIQTGENEVTLDVTLVYEVK